MRNNELRLGNLLMRDGKIGRVVKISDEQPYALIEYNNTVKQTVNSDEYFITLTEDWFKRLGFTISPNSIRQRYSINIKYGTLYIDEEGITSIGSAEGMLTIKYVHLLQNLYFALTGKELEIKKEDND